ncbi:MAG: lamin tail domain-containing protein [Myxococcales bacterium]|nr:lamin tail domain-containing protein [Myxococcales bacterium]
MLRMLRAHGALASLFALACGSDQTAILLSFESSSLGVPEDLDQVRIVAMGESGVMADVTTDLGRTWPQTYAIRPGAGSSSELVAIRVFGLHTGTERLRRVLPPVRFVSGTTIPVRVDLERGCLDVACEGDADCRNGVCTGETPMTDAGVDGGDLDGGETDGGDGDDAGVDAGPSGNLLITEYVEGSGNNKAIEISNVGTGPATTTGCVLRLFSNGATDATNVFSGFPASLPPGGTFVICHPMASIPAGTCDATSLAVNFNGDDALDLLCGGTVVDIFGEIGDRPPLRMTAPWCGWTGGGLATQEMTLRRRCDVSSGRTENGPFNPSLEWRGFVQDTFCDLGVHCTEEMCGDAVPDGSPTCP